MAAATLAIIVIVVLVVLVGLVVGLPMIMSASAGRLERNEKRELRELRATVRKIEVLAARNKGINDADSILATQIEDEIYTYKTKELS